MDVTLKQFMRPLDLAVKAAKKRESKKTGFIHLFLGEQNSTDTIPMYENFCFALSLFRLKTMESVGEARKIVERLLHFQNQEGFFPSYLHEYPYANEVSNSLKIATVLKLILLHFSSVLDVRLKEKIQHAYSVCMESIQKKEMTPVWEDRRRALLGDFSMFEPQTPEEWFEVFVSDQFRAKQNRMPPFHPSLQVWIGSGTSQERAEPMPYPVEWLLVQKTDVASRFIQDHPSQLYLSLVFDMEEISLHAYPNRFFIQTLNEGAQILWQGKILHTFFVPQGKIISSSSNKLELLIDLEGTAQTERNDLFELNCFCNLSDETTIWINEKKGTLFHLGDTLEMKTPTLRIDMRIESVKGEGRYVGHIMKGNRPNQKGALNTLESFDWRIGLRTLERKFPDQIWIYLSIQELE